MNPRQSVVFFFNDTAHTEIYTLSLHDALPILKRLKDPITRRKIKAETTRLIREERGGGDPRNVQIAGCSWEDRKSTRLNSSHSQISYAVFCLKKKNQAMPPPRAGNNHKKHTNH